MESTRRAANEHTTPPARAPPRLLDQVLRGALLVAGAALRLVHLTACLATPVTGAGSRPLFQAPLDELDCPADLVARPAGGHVDHSSAWTTPQKSRLTRRPRPWNRPATRPPIPVTNPPIARPSPRKTPMAFLSVRSRVFPDPSSIPGSSRS